MRSSWWATRRRRRKRSATGTCERSRSSMVCRSRSSMTTPRSRLPAFSAMASVSARACSASCNRTTCSRIGLAARAKVTTRARSRGLWGMCAAEGVDHPRYLMRLAEMEMIDRERRMVDRRIKAARFPTVKSLDSFDFLALPALNKMLVLELARSDYVERRENIIAVGNSGTGKSHIALGLGLAACQKGLSVGFITASALVHELLEARDEKRLLRLQRQLAGYKLLIIDELGYVPLSATGAELLFEVFSQRYERGSTLVTSNLPFDEWTSVFGSERLTGALLDRLTHHVHILEMSGDSYRLNQSKRRSRRASPDTPADNPTQA